MIDTDKYEGHLASEGQTWAWSKWMLNNAETIEQHKATSALLNDAPLLLEAYKQIHDLLAEVLPRKDGVPHFGVTLWGLESELKRVVSEIAIIMGMAEREEE